MQGMTGHVTDEQNVQARLLQQLLRSLCSCRGPRAGDVSPLTFDPLIEDRVAPPLVLEASSLQVRATAPRNRSSVSRSPTGNQAAVIRIRLIRFRRPEPASLSCDCRLWLRLRPTHTSDPAKSEGEGDFVALCCGCVAGEETVWTNGSMIGLLCML